MVEEKQHHDIMPYRFCGTCSKLSPIRFDDPLHPTCLVCDATIKYEIGGRTVLLSKEEANVRNLVYPEEDK